jgi:hypothetical protein
MVKIATMKQALLVGVVFSIGAPGPGCARDTGVGDSPEAGLGLPDAQVPGPDANLASDNATDSLSHLSPVTDADVVVPDAQETLACVAPQCCVPLRQAVRNVSLYEIDGTLFVYFIAERTGTVPSGDEWLIEADVVTSAGGNLAYASYYSVPGDWTYTFVECPAIPMTTPLDCGSLVDVTVALRSSLIEAATGTKTCAGAAPGTTMKFSVPVKCPGCGASQFAPCDVPKESACTSPSLAPNGQSYPMPCTCNLNPDTGNRTWSCAVI